MTTKPPRLRSIDLANILALIEMVEREGSYIGNREYWKKSMDRIRVWAEAQDNFVGERDDE